MAVITYDDGHTVTIPSTVTTATTGHGKTKPVYGLGAAKPLKVVTGSIAFDSSYPTGGEDVSDIFNMFNTVVLLLIDPNTVVHGAQTGKFAQVDYTNKKVLLFTNASPTVEVTNASNQSALTAVKFVAIGY